MPLKMIMGIILTAPTCFIAAFAPEVGRHGLLVPLHCEIRLHLAGIPMVMSKTHTSSVVAARSFHCAGSCTDLHMDSYAQEL